MVNLVIVLITFVNFLYEGADLDIYMYFNTRIYQSTGLTLTHLCARLKPGPGFPTRLISTFNELRHEEIVNFLNIGGIVDHHCLNFLLKILIMIS